MFSVFRNPLCFARTIWYTLRSGAIFRGGIIVGHQYEDDGNLYRCTECGEEFLVLTCDTCGHSRQVPYDIIEFEDV